MSRWLLTPILIFVFAIPGLLGILTAWPYIRHRELPMTFNLDGVWIALGALLFGWIIALMLLRSHRRA